ncbi:glycosyltransferase family 4 protein [Pedobacter montanisoli]|uniref:Glycosyltransferase family 4 protein n=1 Tax=Pedobacter montanisoli TaxID=2923277 RepID=A0ABS9ZVX3_9SPHI|nr:glycosyltransferase family 4 protein [Pedobacter montanisoli]MCJ0742454.1 glycosyltransferase family 4 protein [Pedobacter montanisoli]
MKNVLFLTLKTFSFTGGIERACRTLIRALYLIKGNNVSIWSMYDHQSDLDDRYCNQVLFKGFASQKLSFSFSIIKNAFKFDQVILSHINLLIFGLFIKKLKPSAEIILWAHGVEVWRPLSSWKKRFLQQNATIWAVSSYTKEQLMLLHNIPASSIKVLHHSIDPFYHIPAHLDKPAQLLNTWKLNLSSYVFFTLTRLSSTEHKKHYDSVIRAISRLKTEHSDVMYFIGGKASDDEYLRLTHLIKECNVQDNVKLLGFIPENEITTHYLLANCFVLPSKKEGFGIVFTEAAISGCQIIGGNADGSTDALMNGKLGQLVNPEDEREIYQAMYNAIQKNDHQRAEQQKLALQYFSFEVFKENTQRLLNAS